MRGKRDLDPSPFKALLNILPFNQRRAQAPGHGYIAKRAREVKIRRKAGSLFSPLRRPFYAIGCLPFRTSLP